MILILVLMALAVGGIIGFWLGETYADAKAAADGVSEEREKRIAYLERLVIKLDGPANWEDQYHKELERDLLRR
jgi:membrane protein YqaA with SNARE-associated domain